MSDRCTECKQGYTVEGAAAYPDHIALCRRHADVKLPEANDHDVDALVSLATDHRDKWGDSCHHALAEEVVRLRGLLAARKKVVDEVAMSRWGKQHSCKFTRLSACLACLVEEARTALDG